MGKLQKMREQGLFYSSMFQIFLQAQQKSVRLTGDQKYPQTVAPSERSLLQKYLAELFIQNFGDSLNIHQLCLCEIAFLLECPPAQYTINNISHLISVVSKKLWGANNKGLGIINAIASQTVQKYFTDLLCAFYLKSQHVFSL